MQKRLIILKVLQPLSIVLAAGLLVLMAMLGIRQTAVLSLAVVILAMVPFLLRFEKLRPKPREIVPIVVLSVVAALGRALFTFAPNIQPVTAIVIVAGIVFGSQAGFVTGALCALASNMIMGQGPWTPWQMIAWGLIGYVAGVLESTPVFKNRVFVFIYGFIASFIFGWIMNVWNVYGFVKDASWGAYLTSCGFSFYYDLMHAASTVAFLVLILLPWKKKLLRIKEKFGMSDIN